MKAKLKAKILSVEKAGANSGDTRISLESTGKVQTSNISAQDISLVGSLKLKSLIANEMRLGATITITISDEEENEGSD